MRPETHARNAKHRLALQAGPISIPVLLVRGAHPGKTLVTTGCVHGDEYEGPRAIFETFDELDPAAMRGDWLAVPAANPPAFWAGTRLSPLDGANLARVFPGKPDGTATEVIAWHLGREIIARADFYLDLHSAGVGWSMPAMAGYDASDPRSAAAARLFGAEVIWGHPEVPPGRTVSFARERGIPFLYTEAPGSGRPHPADVAMMKRGIRNLLRMLGVLSGEYERTALRLHLHGEGNIHNGVNAPGAGFWIAEVKLLDAVRAGDLVGRLRNGHGEVTAEFRAPRAGLIGLLREFPVVEKDDPLFLIAEVIES